MLKTFNKLQKGNFSMSPWIHSSYDFLQLFVVFLDHLEKIKKAALLFTRIDAA